MAPRTGTNPGPEYGPEQQLALAYLMRHRNDLDVFVEDPRGQLIYLRMIRTLLGSAVRIEQVFPLGSREKVLEVYTRNTPSSSRPTFFMIDGDLDLLLERDASALPTLYQMKRYCIENLLIQSVAIRHVIEECSDGRLDELASHEDLIVARVEEAGRLLLPLYATFAALHELGSTSRTVQRPVFSFLRDPAHPDSTPLCTRKLAAFRRELECSQSAPRSEVRRRRREILSRARRSSRPAWHFVSAKAALLPLTQAYLRIRCHLKEDTYRLANRLSAMVDWTTETGLVDSLRLAAQPVE